MDENGAPLIDDIGPGARAIKSPLVNPVTRVSSRPRFTKSDLKVNIPAKGMRLTENDREIILRAQGIEE